MRAVTLAAREVTGVSAGLVAADPPSATYSDVLDSSPFAKLQLSVCVLTTLVIVLDGLSMQMLGFAGPLIIRDWGVSKLAFGGAVSAALIGMAIGTFLGGPLGDRWGRRPSLICSIGVFSLATLACVFARDLSQLMVLRLLGGLGFGACFPSATSLVSEWTGRRHRALAIGVITVGVPLGGMVGALIAISAIPVWGWRGCFAVAGGLSILLCVVLLAALPESPGWLSGRVGRETELRLLLSRAWPGMREIGKGAAAFDAPTPDAAKVLCQANVRTNIGLWLAFAANMLTGFALVSWSTIILSAIGAPIAVAVGAALPYGLTSIAATLGGSLLIARYGTLRPVLALASLGTACAVAIAALVLWHAKAPWITPATISAFAVMGGCISGMQALLFVLAANAYPVGRRATGVGVSVASGRMGAVVGAFGSGYVLSAANPAAFFLLSGLGLLLVGAGGLIVDRHIAPKSNSPSRRDHATSSP